MKTIPPQKKTKKWKTLSALAPNLSRLIGAKYMYVTVKK
jgi:hypothetical protein